MARSKTPLALVPTSLAEANTMLGEIGALNRQIETITQELEAGVASLRAKANEAAGPLEKKLKALMASVETYAAANRTTLLPQGKKSVTLPGGEIGWRLPPARASLGRGGEAKAIETIQSLGLTEFIRLTPSLDKEALLRDRPVIPGIKYTQNEQFFVKPAAGKEPESFPGVATK